MSHRTLLGLTLLAATAPAATAQFPRPTGPHRVGTTLFHWIDDARDETFTPDPDDKRELMVQLWYPAAQSAKGQNAKYLPHFDLLRQVLGAAFAAHESAFTKAEVPAIVDAAPLSGKKLPILLFVHGLGTGRLFYTSQILELASHGYCVVSADHTYDSEGVVFPGRLLRQRRDAKASDAEKAAGVAAATKGTKPASERLETWAKDLSFVLDRVGQLARDKASPFHRRLDLARAGVLGHCYGAEAAMLACSRDKRFKACANQNGWPVASEVEESGLDVPLLFMWGEQSSAVVYLAAAGVAEKTMESLAREFRRRQVEVLQRLGTKVYHVEVHKQLHMDFTDLPMLAQWIGQKKPDVGMQMPERMRLVNIYTVAFFDTHLKRKKARLLGLPAPKHRDVTYAVFTGKRKGRRKGKKQAPGLSSK